jgi:hypothetical protein
MLQTTRARDLLIALGLALIAAALYGACFQRGAYGDGAVLLEKLRRGDLDPHLHVLVLPLARALQRWLELADPVAGLVALNVLSGAVGVSATFLLARHFAPRAAALVAAALAMLAPATWTFCTALEVHACHFAGVAVSAAIAIRLPWDRPALASALLALLAAPVVATHRSGILLLPGILWLAREAYRRQRGALSPRSALVLLVVPMIAGTLMTAGFIEALHRGGTSSALDAVWLWQDFRGFAAWWREWPASLGVLAALLALGILRRAFAWSDLALFGCAILPSLAFFSWWGVRENGAYALGSLCFWALLSARALPCASPRRFAALALAALMAQGVLGHQRWRSFVVPEDASGRERLLAAEALFPGAGIVVSLEPELPSLQWFRAEIVELNLCTQLQDAHNRARSPQEFATDLTLLLRSLLADAQRPVAFDFGYERCASREPLVRPYLAAIQSALVRDFVWRASAGEIWPVRRINLRGDPAPR